MNKILKPLIFCLGLVGVQGIIACNQPSDPLPDQGHGGVLTHLEKFDLGDGVTGVIAESVLGILPVDIVTHATNGAITISGNSLSAAVKFREGVASCYKLNLVTGEYFVVGYIAGGNSIPAVEKPKKYGISKNLELELELVQGLNETPSRNYHSEGFVFDPPPTSTEKVLDWEVWQRINFVPGFYNTFIMRIAIPDLPQPYEQWATEIILEGFSDYEQMSFCDSYNSERLVVQGTHFRDNIFDFELSTQGGLILEGANNANGIGFISGALWLGEIGQSKFFEDYISLIPVASTDLNGDNICDVVDFSIFGNLYGGVDPGELVADYNQNFIVDLPDFSFFGNHYYSSCN